MKIKQASLLLFVVARLHGSNADHNDLKSRGEQFKQDVQTLAKNECGNIPRYRIDALKYLQIKVTNAQQSDMVENMARDVAIVSLREDMLIPLRRHFPQSTLLNDPQGRKVMATYYFDAAYEQLKTREQDQKQARIIQRGARKRLAEVVNASNELNHDLRLDRIYAREREQQMVRANGIEKVSSCLSCCMSVEVDE